MAKTKHWGPGEIALDFLIAFILFMVIDQIWLGVISEQYYVKHYVNIQKQPYKPRKQYAVLVYVLLAAGLALFVLPRVRITMRVQDALLWGTIFGILAYGVNDFSNLAIFTNWTVPLTLVDVAWGAFLAAAVTFLIHILRHA